MQYFSTLAKLTGFLTLNKITYFSMTSSSVIKQVNGPYYTIFFLLRYSMFGRQKKSPETVRECTWLHRCQNASHVLDGYLDVFVFVSLGSVWILWSMFNCICFMHSADRKGFGIICTISMWTSLCNFLDILIVHHLNLAIL